MTTYSRRGRRAAAAQERTDRQENCQQRRSNVQAFAHAFQSSRKASALREHTARATMRADLRNQVSNLCMNMQGLLRDFSKLHGERSMHDYHQRLATLGAIQARVDDLLDQAERTRAEHQSAFAAMLSLAHQQRLTQLNRIRHQIAEMLAD